MRRLLARTICAAFGHTFHRRSGVMHWFNFRDGRVIGKWEIVWCKWCALYRTRYTGEPYTDCYGYHADGSIS